MFDYDVIPTIPMPAIFSNGDENSLDECFAIAKENNLQKRNAFSSTDISMFCENILNHAIKTFSSGKTKFEFTEYDVIQYFVIRHSRKSNLMSLIFDGLNSRIEKINESHRPKLSKTKSRIILSCEHWK